MTNQESDDIGGTDNYDRMLILFDFLIRLSRNKGSGYEYAKLAVAQS